MKMEIDALKKEKADLEKQVCVYVCVLVVGSCTCGVGQKQQKCL